MIRRVRYLPIFFCWMVSFGLGGCDFPSDPQLRKVSIVLNGAIMGDAAFLPNPIVVPLAGQVVWTNDDNVPHSVVSEEKEGACAFESAAIGPGKGFRKAFFERVQCSYYCGLHGRSMRGKVVVE